MRVGDILIVALVVLVIVVLLPIILPLALYAYVREKITDRRFKTYLAANEGAKFFCYTARRTSVDYVKEKIIPSLPTDVKVIYLGDSKNQIFSLEDDFPFLHHLVATMKKTEGSYPYVAKIVDGKLVALSLNHRLYSAIRRAAEADVINQRIARFLNGSEEEEAAD